jgi:hypothetical protein
MERMNIPSPKEKDPAKWLGLLKRFAQHKRTLTRVGVIASSIRRASATLSAWVVLVPHLL